MQDTPTATANSRRSLIIIGVILVALAAALLIIQNVNALTTHAVQGDGFKYTVLFSKKATSQKLSGTPVLLGKDDAGHQMYLYVGKAVHSTADCSAATMTGVKVVDTPKIDGNQHNLCFSKSQSIYDLNFTHNNVWYFLTIFPKDKTQTLDPATVKKVAASVQIQ